MRRSLLISALLALTLPIAAYANEDESAPADKPFVLLNSNTTDPGCHAFNQGYSSFGNALRAAGFRVDHHHMTEINDEDLEGVDVFILAIPNFCLLDEYKVVLRHFMRDGGGLLVMGYPKAGDLTNLDSLIRNYGIWFGVSSSDGKLASIPANSPLSGPRTCRTLGGVNGRVYLNINSNSAEAAAVTNHGKNVAAISKHKNLGSGRLVVIGSDYYFANYYIHEYDNEAFGVNVITYLIGGCDLRVTLCKAKLTGGKVKVTAKVSNIGTSASEATIVRFFLSAFNTYPVEPAGVAATLGSVDLPALNPGKKKKVKAKLNIPGWVTPGDYYVIAVADPNGDTGDSDTDNNYKASKKKITIN